MTASSQKSWTLAKRIILDYMKPLWRQIALAFLLMMLVSGATASQAYLLDPIINKIFVNREARQLVPIGLAVMLVFTVRGVAAWGHSIIMSYVGQDIVAKIQSQIFHSLIRQEMAYFQKHNAGSLTSLLVSDVTMMRMSMSDTMANYGKNLLTLIFLVCVMFYQDWHMSVLALVIFPPAGFLVSRLGKKLRQVAKSTQEEQSILSGLLNQSFLGVRQVKAYNAEAHEDERIASTLLRIKKLNNKGARVASAAMPVSEILSGTAIAVIIFYGGSQVIEGISTPGKFFSFIAAFIMAYEPMKRLAKINAGLQVGFASAARIFEAIDSVPQLQDAPRAAPLVVKQPTIVFDNVSFRYPDETLALSHVSFVAEAGQKTALVGPSGSGKSTCLQLLLRFFDVESGRILIDGQDIRDVTQESLRNALSFVSQDVFIFDDTVHNNIAYANAHATPEEVAEAARKAAAEKFIQKLEFGYDTRVGEMGTKLSGGQKQRLAIARAILKDAPILLLDEATSALDTKSEELVSQALDELQKGRTTLVVAHRLSTIKDADKIIVMDHGQVVGTGAHDSLMVQGGLYPTLYTSLTVS